MKVRSVISLSVIALLYFGCPSQGFPKKKLLIGLGVKAHLGNVLLQNAARLAQLKQQLAENVLGTAVKHARTKADLLSVLLSATQAIHKPPMAQYGDHQDVTMSLETTEDTTPPVSVPDTSYTAPEHLSESSYSPPPFNPVIQPAQASAPAYEPPAQSPVPTYGPPVQPLVSSYGPPAPPGTTFGVSNDLQGSASIATSVNAPFTAGRIQRSNQNHHRQYDVRVNAPFVRLNVNSDSGLNLNVGK